MKDKGDKVENIKEIQIATNETILKMVDSMNTTNKRLYKLLISCIIAITIILTTLFGGVIYFLNTFEVEATQTEETITHLIEGDGTINNIGGDGTINNVQSQGDVMMGGTE